MDYFLLRKTGLVRNVTVSSKKIQHQAPLSNAYEFYSRTSGRLRTSKSWITKACEALEYRRNMFSSGNKRLKDQTSASFELALLIAKKKTLMVEGEEIIKPALHIVTNYLGDKASTFATGIPLSDSTMIRRVEMMSEDE